ncbi:MAG TPA: hypothetical protein VJC18_01070, partial [bacterium]|nr:hypothetical protein [bacterium]
MATELLKGQSSSYVDPRVKAVQQEQFDLGDLDGDGKNEFAQLGVTQVSINCAQNESPLSPSITYIDPSMSVGLQSEFAGVLDTFCGEHPTSSVKFDCNPRDFWNQNYEAGDINPSACYAGFSAVGQGYDDPGLNPELRANLPGSLYSSLLPITWSRQTGLINKTISVQEPGNGGKLITGKIIDV